MKAKASQDPGYVPNALRQVWEWKDAIYQETKHLPTREALKEILRRAHAVALEQGFAPSSPAQVAEATGEYRATDPATRRPWKRTRGDRPGSAPAP